MTKKLNSPQHIVKIISLIISVIFMLQIFFTSSMISHGAGSYAVLLNGESVPVDVSGYSSVKSGSYTFNSKLTFTFNSPVKSAFNRYTIEYTANECIGGKIYYKLNNKTQNEDFFLEGGNDMSFSSLIDGYLDSKKGSSVQKIVFEPLSSSSATITIKAINTKVYDVYNTETVYIENDRFKVGCCLIWGGGLNYIEDKKDGDSSVENMLNHHDTGRLVQQSYYGTMSAPYDTGHYNGSEWAYNPVQGGDQHGNKSKLVDFVVTSDTIYVKCRPLDWSKNNEFTFSYMENVYKLEDDHIKVDNRFIDFSGYDHGVKGRHQELPAFYTISYLDTFTFYNGSDPWTDGKLTVKNNLPFWGDSSNQSSCYFNLRRGNTETWCAWTNKKKNYGLGLYTPDVSILLAGRYGYDGSKDPGANSTNYVAPLITSIMRNYEPFQYSYYITAGSVESIRETFTEYRTDQDFVDYTADTTKLSFNDPNEVNAFLKKNEVTITYDSSTGSAVYNAPSYSSYLDCDSYAYVNYSGNVNTKDYRYIVFSYMIPKSNAADKYNVEFFVCTGSIKKAEGGYSYKASLVIDGTFHSMVIDMWNMRGTNGQNLWPSSGETLNCIRVDFDNAHVNDKLYISGFGLAKSSAEATSYSKEFLDVKDNSGNSNNNSNGGSNIVIPSVDQNNTPGSNSGSEKPSQDNNGGSSQQTNPGTNNNNNNSGSSNNGGNNNNSVDDGNNSNNNNGNDSSSSDSDSPEYNEDDEYYDDGNGSDDSKMDIWIIVCIAISGVAVLVAVIMIIIILVKKNKKKVVMPVQQGVPTGSDTTDSDSSRNVTDSDDKWL